MKSLVDNDVLVKGARYNLLRELVATVPGKSGASGILGAARFVVPKLIKRRGLKRNSATALQVFREFVLRNEVVEPTPEEQQLATKLESSAQTLAVNLDVGESQLAAILVGRSVPYLLTGDKRAIVAMERLIDTDGKLVALKGRIRCLEQLVWALIENNDPYKVRKAICTEPAVDKTLSICFSCASPDATKEAICAGLASYVADVRAGAARVLST